MTSNTSEQKPEQQPPQPAPLPTSTTGTNLTKGVNDFLTRIKKSL